MNKRIVFVIESLQLGGAEKSLVSLLNNLDYSKYTVELITFQSNGFFKDFIPKEVNRINIDLPKINYFDRMCYATRRLFNKNYHDAQLFWPIISKHLKKVNKTYDIAIAYNQGFTTYFVHHFITSPIKHAWLNTDYQKAGYNIGFDYPIYKNFKNVIVVSNEAKKSFEEKLLANSYSLNLVVVKDITDKDAIRILANNQINFNFSSDNINIVTVARLIEYKGLHLAVKACKILKEKQMKVRWYVVGEGSERRKLEELITKNNLQQDFFLLGAVTNPYPYIKGADLYVQTSYFEGLGLTVIEAALLHKPIVSTNFPSVLGIIENGKTGLIAEMNEDDIANKIECLILDVDLRNNLIHNLTLLKNDDKGDTLNTINQLLQLDETPLPH